MVETIWEGNVTEFSRAFDLICIVDQIHEYAVNHHRSFVMNHLEAWHARHQKEIEPLKRIFLGLDKIGIDPPDRSSNSPDSDEDLDMDGSDSNSDVIKCLHDIDELARLFDAKSKLPQWLLLKERSKYARQQMANETRRRNRGQLETNSSKSPETRRPRGRPPKTRVAENEARSDGAGQLKTDRRPRGRPPKIRPVNEAANDCTEQLQRTKRPRGRPPKVRIIIEDAPKRRRGRPPKIANKTT